VRLAPVLPPELGDLAIDRVSLAGQELSIRVAAGRTEVGGLPTALRLIEEPAPPPAEPAQESHQ